MKSKILVLMIALFLLLSGMIVAVEGEALDVNFSEENETIEIHDWYDLDAVRDDLEADYVLMNDLDENTDGYDELASEEANKEDEFEEFLGERHQEYENGTRFELFYSPVDELLEVMDLYGEIIEAEIVDSEEGIIEIQEDVEGKIVVQYTTTEEIQLGWEPIGEYRNNPFSGTFDGNGFKIKDLYIDRRHESQIGLFGAIRAGEINNMSLIDINVNGGGRVGGIVGIHGGNIYNSSVTGEVNGESRVGGLAGVIGAEDLFGIIDNSYSRADVSGNRTVGGLVGSHGYGIVENAYAIGNVSGNTSIGGLIGHNDSTVENSFWDIETSGIKESDGGTGLVTEEMAGIDAKENMDCFDFEEVWETVEEDHDDAEEDGYPILQELSREEQLKAQDVYDEEDDDIPGFTLTLLLLAVVITVAIYKKKKR